MLRRLGVFTCRQVGGAGRLGLRLHGDVFFGGVQAHCRRRLQRFSNAGQYSVSRDWCRHQRHVATHPAGLRETCRSEGNIGIRI